ncbi:hypothetical protein ABZ714_13295 [Streptomyces sp. NPDC006798]|uniref:hypothetical protein n=1 Tax=Streptomyces sp. NPDC006798 TaxID=3155462 RepID=UPI0033DDEC9F
MNDDNTSKQDPVLARTAKARAERTDEQNWDALLEQIGRVARHDYESSREDHQKAMELLWEHFENRGTWLADRYREARHIRDESDLGIFVKVYESTTGLTR